MKNYNEVAESVFQRSKEVIGQNNKRRKKLMAIGSAVSCLVIAGAAGFGVWRNSVRGADAVLPEGQFSDDSISYNAGGDTVSDHMDELHEWLGGSGIIGTVPGIAPPDYPTLSGDNDYNGESGSGVSGNGTQSSADVPNSAASSSVPAQTPSGDDASKNESSQAPYQPSEVKVIDSYSRINSSTYDAPANGAVYLSVPLKGAMAEYADANDCRFYVTVDFYKDGECIANSSESFKEEWERLSGHGYDCIYETCSANEHHLSMLLSSGQLESFPAEGYGYTLCLYGECSSGCVHSHCVQHSQNQTDQVNTGGHHSENHGGHHSNDHR